MKQILKEEFPLITPLFWIGLFLTILGALLTVAVIFTVKNDQQMIVGILSSLLMFLMGVIITPASIAKQINKRRSVFYIDANNQMGKTILYRSDNESCRKKGLIAVTVYINGSIINKLIMLINQSMMTTKVYIDDLPDVCVINIVPDGHLKIGKRDIHAMTDGKNIKVEAKENNEWTAKLIEHELIHVILMANKTDVEHHKITRALGV